MTIFFRLLESDDKGTALHQAIQQLAQQQPNPITFAVEPESFQQVPGAPFAYWVSEKIRNLFLKLPPFESEERTVKQGLATANDFCFLRVWWEVPKTKIVSGSATSTLDELRQKTFENKQWVSFAKGGEYSPYYADLHLVVDWEKDGQPVKAKKLHDLTIGRITANNSKCWNEGSYFRAGLTWSQRTQKGLNVRPLPSGCIFGHKGSSGFSSKNEELPFLIGLMNSSAFCRLTELLTCFGSFNEGVIKRVILPSSFSDAEKAELSTLAQHIWLLKRSLDIVIQTSHAFVLPALLQVNGRNLSDGSLRSRAHVWMNKVITVEIELAQIQSKIDDLVFDLYGISEGDRVSLNSSNSVSELAADSDDDDEDSSSAADLSSLTSELLAYTLSVAFGHFDVRLATGDRPLPTEPEPFDPLPVCSPGMLVDENGLPPTEARSLPADYAIVIPFNGILVDDEGHPNDIISHIRDVLKIIWGDQDSDIEQEACEILKVNSLRDYFRK
ncbi:MAG: BREX-1 system adenine-specific DNA-methyltransferase PglX, partial [Phormidesmis sp. CAN_BIN44]|nr:BREX-1 system adenine-specific DNA-methyltransferase PglX [Phormidesmis sp. CAN_BIN44]